MPFDANPLVIVISLIGWTLPASIPSNIPLLKGTGLSQAFLASVQANLAAWPKGPALDDPFWLYMVIWHLGLFTVLFFGTIGYGISQRRNVQADLNNRSNSFWWKVEILPVTAGVFSFMSSGTSPPVENSETVLSSPNNRNTENLLRNYEASSPSTDENRSDGNVLLPFQPSPSGERTQTRRRREEQVVPDLLTGETKSTRNSQLPDLQVEPFPDFVNIYSSLRNPVDGLKVSDRRWMLKTYPKCFTGTEAVEWMTTKLHLSKKEALDLGQRLMTAGVIQPVFGSDVFVEGDSFFRFQEDDDSSILNLKRIWDHSQPTRHPCDLSRELLTKIALLCETFRVQMAADCPRSVLSPYDFDYRKLIETEDFRQYALATSELQGVVLSSLSEKERLVFFVNIYNALCLHGKYLYLHVLFGKEVITFVFMSTLAHITHGPPTSFLKRWVFFRSLCYRIAGMDFSLDDIEHGILRCNKFPPSLRFIRQLRNDDPKTKYIISQEDGRIHFVISAGTRSDPPIRILEEDEVEEELHYATEEFLNQTTRLIKETNEVVLPKIFSWYSDDFPKPVESLLQWVAKYLYSDSRKVLESMLQDTKNLPMIRYENFDWRSEARFNSAIVRRKRRRLERERRQQTNEVKSPRLATAVTTIAEAYETVASRGDSVT
eukprot:jgi/Galph1/5673/GphlegSOOS_G4342.1